MRLRTFVQLGLFALGGAFASSGTAQTTAASGTVIVLPLAAYIPGAYTTTVFVRNPNTSAITINIRYYQSDSANPVGTGTPLACGQLSIPANLAVTFDLGAQCGSAFTGTDNFGQILLEDVTGIYKTNTFFAYSRTESPTGNGFSVEGFPVGNFSSATAESLGLKRTLGAPHYRSNCFVGALNETVNYQIELRQGETGALIGSGVIAGTLAPYHSIRYLDIFNAVPGGNTNTAYANVRAKFSNSSNSAMIGYCTLETSDNGSADFRVAKSADGRDNRQSRLSCYGMDSCTATTGVESAIDPAVITDTTKRNVHYLILDAPDFVKCDLVSQTRLNDLQMVLRGPTDTATGTTPFANSAPPYNAAPYTSGGAGQTNFYVYTGEKGQSIAGSGAATRWYIDVSYRAGGNATTPITYGIRCQSGNGVTIPWLGAQN